jgi:integrative and conjugative element protein (TIGR02256 family)
LSIELIPFGQALPVQDPALLKFDMSRQLLAACHRNTAFDVIELRDRDGFDVIVVDCSDGTVPTRNTVGIRSRERLALVVGRTNSIQVEVRALRVGFPVTLHQNHVIPGEPPSLCIHFEPWHVVERTWTAERQLKRIQWWLRETANETLHRTDQPLEQLYFTPSHQVLLPPNLFEQTSELSTSLKFGTVKANDGEVHIIRALYSDKAEDIRRDSFSADILILTTPPLTHGPVELYPSTLGQLQEQFAARNSDILTALNNKLKELVTSAGLDHLNGSRRTLMVLNVPMTRVANGKPEKNDIRGFYIVADLAKIGVATGVLIDGTDKKAYLDTPLSFGNETVASTVKDDWKAIPIEPLDVRLSSDKRSAKRSSGLVVEECNFKGVLAGVGALGGTLADLWSKCGWGTWTYIDDDILRGHNVIRHIGKDDHVGMSKVDVVGAMVSHNYFPGVETPNVIHSKINAASNAKVTDALAEASILIDATTSLEAPRDLAELDTTPRTASVFLTPSGQGSVLLLEDENRSTRTSSLECQYYRAIINSDWGKHHLSGHQGNLWVGAGCRDISAVLSYELIQLHGATLSTQLRKRASKPDAAMVTWHISEDDGSLIATTIPAAKSHTQTIGDWKITWDEGLKERLHSLRSASLPSETGGILLGYFDMKLHHLFLVDAMSAPSDSDADSSGFTRGKEGIQEHLNECARRTANIVGYVGEWHSHPRNASARPSSLDVQLIAHLASEMAQDGYPALMLIVGERDYSFSLGDKT